jgi:hypothetical protein
MDQKMVRFAQLGAARYHQDESIEVGGVGSQRPPSGGNGGHVVSLYPLTWRSLRRVGAGRVCVPLYHNHTRIKGYGDMI